jgi:hypothetical protein
MDRAGESRIARRTQKGRVLQVCGARPCDQE